jgi:hypothetical protein
MVPSREEFVSRMALRSRDEALMDVPTKLRREEFASRTALSRNDAALRGVPMEPLGGEFVSRMALKGETVQPRGMYQGSRSNGVGMIIAPPKLSLILI